MKLSEIADGISKHLKRFERDKTINAPDPKYKTTNYYYAGAVASGNRVFVTYISYQGQISLKRPEAESYLAWLNAGNVGRHWDVQP